MRRPGLFVATPASMDLPQLLVFTSALAVAAASPGPDVAAIVARTLGRGARDGALLTAGILLRNLVWLTVTVLGLAALAQTFGGVFAAIRYAGAAYLLFLAWKLWTAPAAALGAAESAPAASSPQLVAGGLAVTLGNPKAMLFYVALVPALVDLSRVGPAAYAELVAAMLLVLALVFGGYVGLAARARRMFASPRAIRVVHRTTGAVMAGAAAVIAAR